MISPLNRPSAYAEAARLASADAIHLAMLIGAGLLVAGGVINLVGIRRQASTEAPHPAATAA